MSSDTAAPLPSCECLALRQHAGVVHLTFNRPAVRNALSQQMWQEIAAVFAAIRDDRSIRAVVLRGAGGTFCAGGDLKERAAITTDGSDVDPMRERNRSGGRVLQQIDAAPQVVVCAVEGAAMGGGLGFVCVADVVLATSSARFGLPEVSLGIPPAQLSPFLVRRLGASQTRRLALTAAKLDAQRALDVGLVHQLFADTPALDDALDATLAAIARCAPGAIAATKRLIALTGTLPLDRQLDVAADAFVTAVRSAEGVEGAAAARDKRPAKWSTLS